MCDHNILSLYPSMMIKVVIKEYLSSILLENNGFDGEICGETRKALGDRTDRKSLSR